MITPDPPGLKFVLICTVVFLRISLILLIVCAEVGMAFANSITSPEEAKGNYVTMVAGSKIGGMITALFAWQLLQSLGCSWWSNFTGVQAHQVLMFIIAGMLLCVPLVLYYMIKAVPGRYLHGYESVYQLEKQKSVEGKSSTVS